MLVRHLSYFVTLAREKHFARSRSLQRRSADAFSGDTEAGRGSWRPFGGAEPSLRRVDAQGEKLLAWSRQILTDYHSLIEDLAGERTGVVGVLRLGVIPAAMPAVSFITDLFCATNPDATIEIQSLTSRAIAEGLDNCCYGVLPLHPPS